MSAFGDLFGCASADKQMDTPGKRVHKHILKKTSYSFIENNNC
ncbi:hypothetical protein PORCAN_492 [Porphyromonas crevioricanis JCM 13913]|nr:hypothetical protein PORCAN_492 [Porphyromonas crevioricanis JCM 13913]